MSGNGPVTRYPASISAQVTEGIEAAITGEIEERERVRGHRVERSEVIREAIERGLKVGVAGKISRAKVPCPGAIHAQVTAAMRGAVDDLTGSGRYKMGQVTRAVLLAGLTDMGWRIS